MTAALVASPPEIERFRSAVRERLGLNLDDGKLQLLAEVLRRRTDATKQPSAHYLADLEAGPRSPDELGSLATELTVGETYFFRNIEQFNALAEIVLPERARAQAAGERHLRILSAGCSSGEEAYTLAIVTRESPALVGYQVSIRGVDVNPAIIKRATSGRTTAWALRATSDEMRARYFRADGREFLIDPELRAAVSFERRNLAEPQATLWQPETFDVVFCRNMLMYLAPDVTRAIVDRITRSLVPGGYLFLGSAETLRGVSQNFHLCHTHETFYYQRREENPRPLELDAPGDAPVPIPEVNDSWVEAIQRASDRVRSLTAGGPGGTSQGADPPLAVEAPGGKRRTAAELGVVVDLIRQERFGEARTALALLPDASTRDPDVLLLQAVLLTHGGNLGAAERLCAEVLALDDLSAGAHYLTALCRERAGDGDGAAEHDRAAVYLDPSFAMPHLHLGLLARRAGDSATARRELALALTLLGREDSSRLLMFGGGFGRESLLTLCRAELLACGGTP